jgi:hypothetical protein
MPCRADGEECKALTKFWALSGRDAFRDANIVEIEVAEASLSAGTEACG